MCSTLTAGGTPPWKTRPPIGPSALARRRNVFVHKFVAIGTLEERIDQMIEDKKKLAGSIVGSDESWLTELDNDAFRETNIPE
jgi:hypothetical protein